jgi:hypothetical protein
MSKDEWWSTRKARVALVSHVGLRTWNAMSVEQCDAAVRYADEHGTYEAARILRERATVGGG